MKNSLLLLLFVCMGAHIYGKERSHCQVMQQPVVIDGINTQWGPLNFYDDEHN